MSELAARRADLREWGDVGSTGLSGLERLWLGLVLGVPGLVLALLATLFAGPVPAAIVLVVYALAVFAWIARQGRSALASTGATPLGESESPRVFNLVRGLSADLGIDPPSVWVTASESPDASIFSSGGPGLAVSRGLLETYTRTELEAVVAHCLTRIAGGDLRRASLAAALGAAAGPAGVSNFVDADTRTVALTRYPPALASAISKASPARGSRRSFHFVPGGPVVTPQEERTDLLQNL